MTARWRRYSKEELARRGEDFDESQIRQQNSQTWFIQIGRRGVRCFGFCAATIIWDGKY